MRLLPITGRADSFAYSFSQTVAMFSVTGTITTDADSGFLQTSDITGYDLVLTEGSRP